MFRRTWKRATYEPATTESKITLYDFGGYCGEMIDDEWSCWEIHSRTQNDMGEIVEELIPMSQDWIPFESFKQEAYRGKSLQGLGFQIREWTVQTELLSEPPPSQLNHKSKVPEHRQIPSPPQSKDKRRHSTRYEKDYNRVTGQPKQLSDLKSPLLSQDSSNTPGFETARVISQEPSANKTFNSIKTKQNKYIGGWTPLVQVVKLSQ
jgi:hypothetical protein